MTLGPGREEKTGGLGFVFWGGFFDKEIRKLQQQNWVFKSTAVD